MGLTYEMSDEKHGSMKKALKGIERVKKIMLLNKKGRKDEKDIFQKIVSMGADPDDGHHVHAAGDVLWGSRSNTGAFEDSDR